MLVLSEAVLVLVLDCPRREEQKRTGRMYPRDRAMRWPWQASRFDYEHEHRRAATEHEQDLLSCQNVTHQRGRAKDLQAYQNVCHPSSVACDGYPPSAFRSGFYITFRERNIVPSLKYARVCPPFEAGSVANAASGSAKPSRSSSNR